MKWTWMQQRNKKFPTGLSLKLGSHRTSAQWRSDPDAVASAVQLLASDPGKEMLAILHAEVPSRISPLPLGATEAEVVRAYGFELGWQAAVMHLQSLAEPFGMGEREPSFRDEFSTD